MARDKPSSRADIRWMKEALGLAARGRGRTAPNPLVGAVIVRGSRRISGGYHARVGGSHAETAALAKVRDRVRGATLYVTLEPCAHWGRTPPCADALVEAGLRRVVVGMRDPDPRTRGRGIAKLRRAGIEVLVGVEQAACRALNRGFLSRVERGRPFTTLKLASSLDGRIATASGDSRWITGERAREQVHTLRRGVDAIVVGSRTATVDDPELTARRAGRVVHRPVRVVVDSRLRLPSSARLLGAGPRGTAWLLAARDAPAARKRALEAAGARIIPVRKARGRLDLHAAWRALGRLGINDLLVEGGGELAAALLRAGLVDRLLLFMAPVLVGADGRPVLAELGVDRLHQALRPKTLALRRLAPDLLLVGEW